MMNRNFNNPPGNVFQRNSPPFQINRPNNMQYIQRHPVQMPGYGVPNNSPPQSMSPSRQNGFFRRSARQKAARFGQQPQDFTNMQRSFSNQQEKPKGGFLSKILGKSKQRNNPSPSPSLFSLPSSSARNAAAASQAVSAGSSGGGFLQSLANPATLSTMLNNTQRVLQTAESFGPLVQQYGPLVKNIPAMWKLYKGLSDVEPTESTDTVTEKEATTIIEESKGVDKEPSIESNRHIASVNNKQPLHVKPKKISESPTAIYRQGESKPKLFF